MEKFQRIVMISPVGLEMDRILTGFKKFGITHLYLIQSEEKDEKDDEKRLADTVRSFASILKSTLEKIYEENVNLKNANITDLKDCLRVLKEIVSFELTQEVNKIYINISTSSKIFAIAAVYLAGLTPNLLIPFYARTSNYLIQDFIETLELIKDHEKCVKELIKIKEKFKKSGWTTGEYEIKLIPALPFKKFTDFQKKIFKDLINNNNQSIMSDLVENLKSKGLSEESLRSKLSYALRDLINYGFIEKVKSGRYVSLILTEIGTIFGNYLI